MKLIKPSFEILTHIDGESILKEMEIAARTCYKSEGKIQYDEGWNKPHQTSKAVSARPLLIKLIERGHFAMLEFGGSITVKFVCDRGVSHELVRHRHCSFAQESTRYVNYGKDEHIQFIAPNWLPDIQMGVHDSKAIMLASDELLDRGDISDEDLKELAFLNGCASSEYNYDKLMSLGATPQQARNVLINAVKTEINMSTNIRDWRHIFTLRCAKAAHPQMRELMIPLLEEFKRRIPVLFDDITY